MIPRSAPSVSDHLSLEEVIARLAASPLVDGLAEFGSRAAGQDSPMSDYDLLVLAYGIPARVFQMVTTVGGRLADIVLVETETADALLAASDPPAPGSFEALFALKMQTARIRYDASGRLHAVQQRAGGPEWAAQGAGGLPESDLYAAWFWQSFGVLQLEQLAQSQDQLHLTAFDMVLASCLPGTWRSYFSIRGIPWEGEKAALRYWSEHDADYMGILHRCLEAGSRPGRLTVYRELVAQTLSPVGSVFGRGETAAILSGSHDVAADVQRTLKFWDSLVGLLPKTERRED